MATARRIALALGGALLLAPAGAHASSPEALAARLASNPVFVETGAHPTLTEAQAGKVRLEILQKDIGRVHIAVVRNSTAAAAGGLRSLANRIDAHLDNKGTLLVDAGRHTYLVTSFRDSDGAARAVQDAFDHHRGLEAQLVAAVDGLAEVDPGPSEDLNAPQTAPPINIPDPNRIANQTFHFITVVFIVVGLIIVLPFVVIGLIWMRNSWRRRRAQRSDVAQSVATAKDRLIQLGEGVQALDIDTSMPGVHEDAKAKYTQALDDYDRANKLLDSQIGDYRQLAAVQAALDDGERCLAETRKLLGEKS